MNREVKVYACAVEFKDRSGKPYTQVYHIVAHDFGTADMMLRRWIDEWVNGGDYEVRNMTMLGDVVAQPKTNV